MTITPTTQSHAECPVCGAATLSVVSSPSQVEATGGRQVIIDDELTTCTSCGTEFYSPAQSDSRSAKIVAAVQSQHRLHSGDAIKRIRLMFGLSQSAFETVLGVGRKTAVRWERGTCPQSDPVDGLIWIADNFPDVFCALAARRGVTVNRDPSHITTVKYYHTAAYGDKQAYYLVSYSGKPAKGVELKRALGTNKSFSIDSSDLKAVGL